MSKVSENFHYYREGHVDDRKYYWIKLERLLDEQDHAWLDNIVQQNIVIVDLSRNMTLETAYEQMMATGRLFIIWDNQTIYLNESCLGISDNAEISKYDFRDPVGPHLIIKWALSKTPNQCNTELDLSSVMPHIKSVEITRTVTPIYESSLASAIEPINARNSESTEEDEESRAQADALSFLDQWPEDKKSLLGVYRQLNIQEITKTRSNRALMKVYRLTTPETSLVLMEEIQRTALLSTCKIAPSDLCIVELYIKRMTDYAETPQR